ncbi:hypothetical protein HYALB_00004716 [Hymenoscyphus albidus]|uniref:Heterokaryon incompatibility domain-containing protein n=1 Tax=Hymenoscyphus albidus TaxID=595503 RepID=A0A9N9M0C2_9HELO|nr:hypothetical protein HYALB_00004716 [Hymenoscyphus albidus]
MAQADNCILPNDSKPTLRYQLFWAIGTSWEVIKSVASIVRLRIYSQASASSTSIEDTVVDDGLDTPDSHIHSGSFSQQPTLYQVFQSILLDTENDNDGWSSPHPSTSSDFASFDDKSEQGNNRALDDGAGIPTLQDIEPIQLYNHFREIFENIELKNDRRDLTKWSFDLFVERMVKDLRAREILHYLVLEGLQDAFCGIYKTELQLKRNDENEKATIALAAYWLHQCWSTHPECPSPNILSQRWPILPKRVVDLTEYQTPYSSNSKVKVFDTCGLRGAYVALSYCWPSTPKRSSILTRETPSDFTNGVLSCNLICEIQEACTITKGLGIQYLWVDALCIVQGRGGDWHIQANKMPSIYKNAVLTIASGGQTSLAEASRETEFIVKPADNRYSQLPLKDWSQERIHEWFFNTGNFVYRPFEQLDTRGWVFQEQLLSPRTIYLTSEGLFWDCLHHSASCNRPTGIPGDFSPHFRDADSRALKFFLLGSHTSVPKEEYYWLWRRAVQNYTIRDLSRKKDRYIALLGITDQMASHLDDDCILGVWKKDPLRSLAWFVDSTEPQKWQHFEERVQAPSWSWISVNGPVNYQLWHPPQLHIDPKGAEISKMARVPKLSANRQGSLGFDDFSGHLVIISALAKAYILGSTICLATTWKDRTSLAESLSSPETRGVIEFVQSTPASFGSNCFLEYILYGRIYSE